MDRRDPGHPHPADTAPDFWFARMDHDDKPWGASWQPQFGDYLYLSLTNAVAFSPTDTMPLTRSAKIVMGVQSIAALATIGMVIARAVNVLGYECEAGLLRPRTASSFERKRDPGA